MNDTRTVPAATLRNRRRRVGHPLVELTRSRFRVLLT